MFRTVLTTEGAVRHCQEVFLIINSVSVSAGYRLAGPALLCGSQCWSLQDF
jgi:hypothetical protein